MTEKLFDEHGRPIKVIGNETTDIFDEHGRPVIVIAAGEDPLKFTDLDDTPEDYEGNAGKMLVVNEGEDALEFAEVPEVGEEIDDDDYLWQLFTRSKLYQPPQIYTVEQTNGATVEWGGDLYDLKMNNNNNAACYGAIYHHIAVDGESSQHWQWDKVFKFMVMVSRANSDVNFLGGINFKYAPARGILASLGIGLVTTNLTLALETYGVSGRATAELLTITEYNTYYIIVTHTPGVSVVAKNPAGTILGSITDTSKIPAGTDASSGPYSWNMWAQSSSTPSTGIIAISLPITNTPFS